jgi:hypothetical protein
LGSSLLASAIVIVYSYVLYEQERKRKTAQ